MVYLILLGLTFIIQLFAVSWYIMTEELKSKIAALKTKLVCSALFIIDAVLAAAIRGSFSSGYFILILLGEICCYIGDIFLNLEPKGAFTAGLFFFLGGHAFYSCAFSVTLWKMFYIPFFSLTDIIIWIAVITAFTALTFIKKLFDFNGLRAAVISYSAVIALMVIKAVHLGTLCQLTMKAEMQSLSFALIVGSLGFFISDLILLFMCFGGKHTHKNSLLNAYTYFFSQMILACSILFIGG